MTKLVWDKVGDRRYESGLDRGVLYLSDGTGVPWNGLVSADVVSENGESTPLYFNGVKTFDLNTPGDFSADITAITYPDEFLQFDGVSEVGLGAFLDNQPIDTFSLSYRTFIGDDVNGATYGYKIHVIYNLTAVPSSVSNQSISDSVTPLPFSWKVSSTPEFISDRRQTSHLVFDSTKLEPTAISSIEDTLYGTAITGPRLPTIAELLAQTGNVILSPYHVDWPAWSAADSVSGFTFTRIQNSMYLGAGLASQTGPSEADNADSVGYLFGVEAGTYNITIIRDGDAYRAIYDVKVDGTTVGTVDAYSGSYAADVVSEISGVVLSAGVHTLTVMANGKNASSNDYVIALQWLSLDRTGA